MLITPSFKKGLIVEQLQFQRNYTLKMIACVICFALCKTGLKAKLVEHCTGIAEVVGSNIVLAPVVQRLDNAIHRINHYPADSVVCFVNTYPLDSDLSAG